jgi:hypothetical protein
MKNNDTMNINTFILNLNDTQYNILSDDWTYCVNDHNNIFYGEPRIFKIICEIFNQLTNYTHIILTNLNRDQRHPVYRALSYFKFVWNKSVDSNGANTIEVNIENCWVIPYQPPWHIISSPTKKIALENLYSSITNRTLSPSGDLCVNMDDFVKYHVINNKYYNDTNNLAYTTLTDNTTKKLQLSDMIFDIKDDITDLMFKTIMEKLSEL